MMVSATSVVMIFRLVCLVAPLLVSLDARPLAPGSCDGEAGADSIDGPHLSYNEAGTGSLESAGYSVSLGGELLSSGSIATITAGTDIPIEITSSTSPFRGFLAKVVGADFPTTASFMSPAADQTLVQSPVICTGSGIGAISHNSRADKTTVSGILNVPSATDDLVLDVTIVKFNNVAMGSAWYFTSYSIAVVAPEPTSAPAGSVVDVAVATPQLSELVALVQQAGLAAAFANETSDLTVFAPVNTAFDDLPEDLVTNLVSDEWSLHLQDVLLYHVSNEGALLSTDLVLSQSIGMLNFDVTTVTSLNPVTIDEVAEVTMPDVIASNGVVHLVDSVLSPPSVLFDIVDFGESDGNFSTLVTLLEASGLNETLRGPGPFTVFAPLDEAFDALPTGALADLLEPNNAAALQELLELHVLPNILYSSNIKDGAEYPTVAGLNVQASLTSNGVQPVNVTINNALIIFEDVLANNGVIHVVDSVILPAQGNIVEIAQSANDFSQLVALAEQAELTEDLSSAGPLTLFAPRDSAFETLDADVVSRLTNPDWSEHLVDVLAYHVIEGAAVLSTQLEVGQVVTMGNDQNITVTSLDPVVINSIASLVDGLFDVQASNGVIHTVNQVLLPPSVQFGVVEIGESDENFSRLIALLNLADLAESLRGQAPVTIFAPPNSAFEALGTDTLSKLAEDLDELRRILLYHVVPDVLYEFEIEDGASIVTASLGSRLEASVVADTIKVNDATLIDTDILGNNGVVHVIDTVLMPKPPTIVDAVSANPNFSQLVDLLESASLVSTLAGEGPFTVFAPSNSAFSNLDSAVVTRLSDSAWTLHLVDVLTYHVLDGSVLSSALVEGQVVTMLNGEDVTVSLDPITLNGLSEVISLDVNVSNGVIHVVDEVLLPTSATSTVVGFLESDPKFSTLVGLVGSANLVDTLNGSGPFTVFAPTNEAFNNLEEGSIEALSAPENVQLLSSLLSYHVVGDVLYSAGLEATDYTTVEGTSITVSFTGTNTMINNAKVTDIDNLGSNGVVHVIDSVLFGPEDQPTGAPTPGPTPAPVPDATEAPSAAASFNFILPAVAVGVSLMALA